MEIDEEGGAQTEVQPHDSGLLLSTKVGRYKTALAYSVGMVTRNVFQDLSLC